MTLLELVKFSQVINVLPTRDRIRQLKAGDMVVATDQQLKEVLSHELFIKRYEVSYDKFVKDYFKDNTVMVNKWLRYAENIRSL
jgi:hypothetical protein